MKKLILKAILNEDICVIGYLATVKHRPTFGIRLFFADFNGNIEYASLTVYRESDLAAEGCFLYL